MTPHIPHEARTLIRYCVANGHDFERDAAPWLREAVRLGYRGVRASEFVVAGLGAGPSALGAVAAMPPPA